MSGAEHELMHPAHARAWSLLPWYVNGSLADQERLLVRDHLGECLVCAREHRRLEILATAVAEAVEEHACNRAYARFAQRVAGAAPGRRRWPRLWFEPLPLVAGAVLLICSAALVGGVVVSRDQGGLEPRQSFQTLGRQSAQSSALAEPVLRVVLRDPGRAALDAWLKRHVAEVLEGPSEIGVLTVKVALAPRTFDAMLARIRADEETLFVEPVNRVGMRPDRQR